MVLRVQDVRLSSLNVNTDLNKSTNPQPLAGGFVEVNAFAKINLLLAVIKKRNDGYHEIKSIAQGLSLHDSLHISNLGGTKGQVTLEIDMPDNPKFCAEFSGVFDGSVQKNNLVQKAAHAIMHKHNIVENVHIKLTKRIPIGAGLGGGSSDAAATILGLTKLFEINESVSSLAELSASIGADCPVCTLINNNKITFAVGGMGERLKPLGKHPLCHVVLACPNIHISTAEIYGQIASATNDTVLYNFEKAFAENNLSQIAAEFYNQFTPITSGYCKQIPNLITSFKVNGALNASMTGTGATVFAYYENENTAKMACDKLQKIYTDTNFFVTTTI